MKPRDPVHRPEDRRTTERRRIALGLLAMGPVTPAALAAQLPATIGLRASDPDVRRREVAEQVLGGLVDEGAAVRDGRAFRKVEQFPHPGHG